MTYDNDALFADLHDLTNHSFKAWYMKMFYAIGKDEVLRLASIARSDGKDKRKYFSKLLKEAHNGKTSKTQRWSSENAQNVERLKEYRAANFQRSSY